MFGPDVLTTVDRNLVRWTAPLATWNCRWRRIFAVRMSTLPFSKWHGTGNDFILVDDRNGQAPKNQRELAIALCDRHFGIGGDGLILLQAPHLQGTDYHMEFFNPDGSRSFCGNGSRCAYAFRSSLTDDRSPARFSAIDGVHTIAWKGEEVEVSMRDTSGIERIGEGLELLHTGSPHLLVWVDDPAAVDIVPAARLHRYGPRFKAEGVNVNFVRWHAGAVEMRTYERGVEAETMSCGTGVTAAALSAMARGLGADERIVRTPGGELGVHAEARGDGFSDVRLRGPVEEVYTGTVRTRV